MKKVLEVFKNYWPYIAAGSVLVVAVLLVNTCHVPASVRTTENTPTISTVEQVRAILNEQEIKNLKDELAIVKENNHTLFEAYGDIELPEYPTPDMSQFVTKGALSALEGKIELLLQELADSKTIYSASNLYASFVILENEFKELQTLIPFTDNVTDFNARLALFNSRLTAHIADNTTHK